jgi:hypothetical protein
MWEEWKKLDREGVRTPPPGFAARLKRAFPNAELKVVWNDSRACWLILQKGRYSGEWLLLAPWHREPAEDLIEALKMGELGSRSMPDPVALADKQLRDQDEAQIKSRQAILEEVNGRAKLAKYYLPAALGLERAPLNPRYTHGWKA